MGHFWTTILERTNQIYQQTRIFVILLCLASSWIPTTAKSSGCTVNVPKYCEDKGCSGPCKLPKGQVEYHYKEKTFTIFDVPGSEYVGTLPDNFFEDIDDVLRLSIRADGIDTIQRKLLEGVTNLKFLEIQSSNLTSISPEVLESNIDILVVTGTSIDTVPLLKPSCELKTFVLSKSRIESLENVSLGNCRNLANLDLSGNVIRTLPSNLLAKCDKLMYISLRLNNIAEVPDGFFNNCTQLEEVDLSRNKLKSLSIAVFPTSNSVIRYFSLEGNKLQDLPEELFARLKDLEVINLNNNQISHLPEHLFGNCSLLRLLLLKGNLLESPPVNLINKCDLLHVVELGDNHLTTVPAGFFKTCKSVSVVGLTNNRLANLSVDLFSNCLELRTLQLDGNGLESFEFEFKSPILRWISGKQNKLKKIAPRRVATCLQYVDWSGNELTALPISQLTRFQHVGDSVYSTVYNVSFNKFRRLVNRMFLLECPVSVLDCSHNDISVLEDGWTIGLQKVKNLSLSHNELVEISIRSFILLNDLQVLILSSNKIRTINEYAFLQIPELVKLDLSDNQLLFSNFLPVLPPKLAILNIFNTSLPSSFEIAKEVHLGPFTDYAKLVRAVIAVEERKNASVVTRNPSLSCLCINHIFANLSVKVKNVNEDCLVNGNSSNCAMGISDCPTNCTCFADVEGKVLVDCRGKDMTMIPQQIPTNSIVVHLERNKFFDFIDFKHPSWSTVSELYLKESFVGGNVDMVGTNLKSLKVLDLSGNEFELVKSLRGFSDVLHLNLSRNNISRVTNQVFGELEKLEVLDLSHNHLDSVQLNLNLRILYLNNNRLRSLSAVDLLAGVSSVKRLYMNDNLLRRNGSEWSFSNWTNLEMLTLSGNQLSFGVQDFARLPSSLIVMDVSNNFISGSLLNVTFPVNISVVDMRNNSINEIQLHFGQTISFVSVHLEHNMIEALDVAKENNNEVELVNIHLDGNNLMCNCNLSHFWQMVFNNTNSKFFLSAPEASCGQPISMKTRSFDSLNHNELLCENVEPCPDGCYCYSQFYKGVTMDCTKTSLDSIPPKAPPNVKVLYTNSVRNLSGLLNSSWENLTEFYVQGEQGNEIVDSAALRSLHNLHYLELTKDCWCKTQDYVSYDIAGDKGKCTLHLPFPQCFKESEDSNTWSLVECSNYDSLPNYTNIPVCYMLCKPCHCYLDVDLLLVMNCSKLEMTSFPVEDVQNVSILDMDYNLIRELPDLSLWESLSTLYVRNNRIVTITDSRVLPNGLRFVYLDGNLIQDPSGWLDAVMTDESFLEVHVSLVGNDLDCNCDKDPSNFELWSYTRATRLLLNSNSTYCTRNRETRLLLKSLQCNTPDIVLIVCLCVLLAMVVAVAVLISCYFRHRRAIYVSMLAHNWCLCLFHEESANDDKEFDAFISYSSDDSNFVSQELVPGLEGGRKGFEYKICVHERDWLGGQFISEQIVESVQKSRRTIIVLTENFLSSVWATLEFKVALQQALEEKFNRIVVVVPGELPGKDKMDSDLKSFIAMNTYLLYDDPKFWDKLLFSMPRVTRKAPVRRFPKDFIEMMSETKSS